METKNIKKQKITILVTDGETWEALKFIRCLGNCSEYRIHVQSKSKKALSRHSRYCYKFHYTQSDGIKEWAQLIKKITENEKLDLIVPIKEKTIIFFRRYFNKFSETVKILPVPSLESLLITSNKWRFQNLVDNMALPTIPSILLGKVGERKSKEIDLKALPFPALIKPTEQEGGHGILKINDIKELLQLLSDSSAIKKGKEYYLQSYLPGEDYCLQLYSRNGKILAYTIQKSLQSKLDSFGPQRVMEFVQNEEILKLSEIIIFELKWDGFACIDFRKDGKENTYKVIEINPRIGQAILGSLLKGVNFAEIGCRDALELKLKSLNYEPGIYAHPKAYLKMVLDKINSRKIRRKISWKNSGLKFVTRDPIPEILYAIREIFS